MFPDEGPAGAGGRNNCLECHSYGQGRTEGIPTRVEPTKVPEVWFTHARFDHTAHRAVSCRECHAGSYALNEDGTTPNPKASKEAADVLIPAIDNCVQCHAPARGRGGLFGLAKPENLSVASSDCTECHRYHDGDRPHQGFGTPARDGTAERTIAEFLRGATLPTKSPRP